MKNPIQADENELGKQKDIDWDLAFSFIQDFGFDSSKNDIGVYSFGCKKYCGTGKLDSHLGDLIIK